MWLHSVFRQLPQILDLIFLKLIWGHWTWCVFRGPYMCTLGNGNMMAGSDFYGLMKANQVSSHFIIMIHLKLTFIAPPLVKAEGGVCSSALRPQSACLHSHWWSFKSFAMIILLTPEQPHDFVGIYLFYTLKNWGIHQLKDVKFMQIWRDKVLIVF